MIELYMVIIPILVITTLIGIYWAVANYRQYKLNLKVSEELNIIIESTMATVEKIKRNQKFGDGVIEGKEDIFKSAGMLSTLVTVLIHKLGDTRLGIKDFMLADDQYVSIYVDSTTDEIILSLDKQLGEVDYSLIHFKKGDDSTFH